MKAEQGGILIFGSGGTLGRRMLQHLDHLGLRHQVHLWDRQKQDLLTADDRLPNFDLAIRPVLELLRPRLVFNFAIAGHGTSRETQGINVDLPVWLAQTSQELGFRLLHTSSVMVFDGNRAGPHSVLSPATASEGYGLQKRLADENMLAAVSPHNTSVTIARIGWQIDSCPYSNTMRRYLEEEARRNAGRIRASSLWIPSCSRLEHTIDSLWGLAHSDPGLYHIEGNRDMSFADIATRLRAEYSAWHWTIERTTDLNVIQRMLDDRVSLPPLFLDSETTQVIQRPACDHQPRALDQEGSRTEGRSKN